MMLPPLARRPVLHAQEILDRIQPRYDTHGVTNDMAKENLNERTIEYIKTLVGEPLP